MAEDVLFSESWHLVASQRPALRPDLRVKRLRFRGETWRVIGDPMRNDWFRVRAEAWRFLVALDGSRTVEEAWRFVLETSPGDAPGQQEVVQLVARLHGAGLLRGDLPLDGAALFKRLQRRRRREVSSQWLNFLFMRFPLWDPQRTLVALSGLGRVIFSKFGLVVWLGLLVAGLAMGLSRADEFLSQVEGILAPTNLLWLYVAWVLLKLGHEMAHGMAVRRCGGEVHVMGIMLLVFTPMPYVDASAAWGFRRRRDRTLVGAAGMMSDLAVAAIAVIVWANTGPGLISALAHNIVIIGSIATLAFNGNPLLRFDSYFILCDLMDQPNMGTRANQQMRAVSERWFFGRREAKPVGRTPREGFWLGAYGIAALAYRLFLMTVIVMFVAGQLFAVGMLIAVFAIITWGIVPLVKFARYLATSTALNRCRSRAVGVTLGTLAAVLIFLLLVPMPNRFRAPGVVRAVDAATVVASSEGRIGDISVQSGEWVEAGQPLLQLSNLELEVSVEQLTAMEEEVAARLVWARDQNPAQLAPLRARRDFLATQRDELENRIAGLTVKAPHAGKFLAPYLEDYPGMWIMRGTELGSVIGDDTVYFSSVVAQRAAADLFRGDLSEGEVWLPGADVSPVQAGVPELVPVDRSTLPSASLGWLAGGELAVVQDETGVVTTEPYYEVRLPLPSGRPYRHLREGVARLELAPAPWGVQGWRFLRQLLQQRYQI